MNCDFDPFEICLMSLKMQEGDCEEIKELAKYLDFQTAYKWDNVYENLDQRKEPPLSSEIEVPKLELKSLPNHLWYEFFGENSTLPIIISAHLDEEQCAKLLRILRKHKKSVGQTISDIKDTSHYICMHRILLEKNHTLVVEMQRRLNPNMKEM